MKVFISDRIVIADCPLLLNAQDISQPLAYERDEDAALISPI